MKQTTEQYLKDVMGVFSEGDRLEWDGDIITLYGCGGNTLSEHNTVTEITTIF